MGLPQIYPATLQRIVAPEMAEHALIIARQSKAQQVGQEWLMKHPLEAAVGLAPMARGKGKIADEAKEHLALMRRSDQANVLEAAKAHLDEETVAWLQTEIIEDEDSMMEVLPTEEIPASLAKALADAPKTKLPAWAVPSMYPPIKIGGKRLDDESVEKALQEFKKVLVPETSSVAAALKEHADPTSLDTFAWKGFQNWSAMGSVSKEKWVMGVIGHLGGDGCVLNLTPQVREWPGKSQHQRAVFGLHCLRAINSETALMALNGIALKLKYKGLKEKAREAMNEIAKARGLTREQLADRIVPDCGLDENGRRAFDFGPRQFQFILGGDSKPMVKDAAGKLRANMPKPNQKDDPAKAETALAEWKVMKKTLRESLKVQGARMESSMITGRRWTTEDFEAYVVKHPFMLNLARQLVFGNYDTKGELLGSFRITEDGTMADQSDDDAPYPTEGFIGVLHPAHLDEGARSAWGEVLADYGIIPPFEQIGRTICAPEKDDLGATEITRYKGPQIEGIVLYGMLERSGWLRDTPADGGGFSQHSRYFEAADVTAFIAYDPGLSISWYEESQRLTSVHFVKGHIEPSMWGDHSKKAMKIKDADPVVVSEVLRLVNAIAAKAQ